jgi:general secretion pathway protein A
MFLNYYGLRDQPFGVTPDPRYLYLSSSHREALASLHYGIETKRGFSALVGEPGMGKTSLLLRLLDNLKSSARTAFLFQTDCDPQGFLRGLLKDLGIPGRGKDVARMHEALNKALLEEMHAGRRFVVVVDEAQNLDDKVLESIRLLSNFETPTAKLMHVVLAGQPQLSDRLARPELSQLRQRVGTIIRLVPFSRRETISYIEHRLRLAGYEGDGLFTLEAQSLIVHASHGIPRNVNSLCFQALSLGFATGSRTINGEIVREVLADAEITPKSDRPPANVEFPSIPVPVGGFSSFSYQQPPPFSAMRAGVAFFGFVIVPLLLIVLLSALKLGIANTAASQFAERVIGGSGGNVANDTPPPLPAALQPPKPAPIAYKHDEPKPTELPAEEEPDESAADSTPSWSPVVSAQAGETLFDIARKYFGRSDWTIVEEIRSLNPSIREPYDALGEGAQIRLPSPAVPGGRTGPAKIRDETNKPQRFRGPYVVQLAHRETAFDIAKEYLGRQDWQTVEELRTLNPQIREPYAGIPAGTRIVLPSRPQLRSEPASALRSR